MCLHECPCPQHACLRRSDRIYFKVVHKTPSRQKRLARPAAAAGTLQADHLAVTLLHCQNSADGIPRFDVSVSLGAELRTRVVVLSYLHSDPMALKADLLVHADPSELACRVEGLDPAELDHATFRRVVDAMFAAIAMPGRDVGYIALPEEEATLRLLADHGVVESSPGGNADVQWFFTHAGIRKLKYDAPIAAGRPILEPCPEA